ncbi:MAG: DUF975 family protein [Ruminococcaceae bacterium]|nr:DUF975 family protein [Oscillospiraceae bacterium]
MWTRSLLKNNAKEMLKKHYWEVFLVCFILSIISSGISSVSSGMGSAGFNFNIDLSAPNSPFNNDMLPSEAVLGFLTVFIIALAVAGILFVISIAFNIFVAFPFSVGVNKYILNSYRDKNEFNDMIFCFKANRYIPTVKAMALRFLYEFLWSLLFIIPGIVKGYAYSMVPYILADNPQIGAKRAIELSQQMTKGEKGEIFILDLSFIGWYLLGTIVCCGLGTVFVVPYAMSTKAYLYMILRDKAIINGYCTYEELGFSAPTVDETTQENI